MTEGLEEAPEEEEEGGGAAKRRRSKVMEGPSRARDKLYDEA